MKRSLIHAVAGLMVGLGIGLHPYPAAGEQQSPGQYIENPKTSVPVEIKIIGRASRMLERPVYNLKGVLLGTSKDFVIGEGGRVTYLIIERGSAFGQVGHLTPLPWSMVQVEESGKTLKVDLSFETIRDAPGFPVKKWPEIFSPDLVDKINKHYQSHH